MHNVFLCVAIAAVYGFADGCSPRARFSPPDAGSAPLYANVWAVEIDGSKEEADALARKYHFVNKGQVNANAQENTVYHTVVL